MKTIILDNIQDPANLGVIIRSCIAFGLAFKIPVIIQFKMPDPTPSSDSCNVSNIWFVNRH